MAELFSCGRSFIGFIINALAPGGGFICAPVHNVQGDVPPENLVAMRDAVEEFGYYPMAGEDAARGDKRQFPSLLSPAQTKLQSKALLRTLQHC